MSQLKSHDLADLDKYFQGNEAGYVLDFSNKTFADFFAEYLDVDIDNEEYSKEGTSKDKRLKYYLKIVDDKTALETITALEKNKSNTIFANNPKHTSALLDKIENIKNRLSDSNDAILIEKIVRPVSYDSKKYIEYLSRINKLKSIDPHKRGYDFQKYLCDLFKDFHLNPREAFRIIGEQIDGSFELDGETYLIEAKWTNKPIDNQSLGGFHSKIEQKTAWTRGVFISFGGFTDEGISAFGRGRRIVCVSGKDIFDALTNEIPISTMLRKKIRHAAETGEINAPLLSIKQTKSRIQLGEMEPAMAGLKDKRGFIDKDRIDLTERQSVEYWMKKWGVTRDQIVTAHRKVGRMTKDIAAELGKKR